MRRSILILSSLIVMFIFLVSCAPPLTDEELEAELAKLTPEERAELLADLEAKEGGALAGQGSKQIIAARPYYGKLSPSVADRVVRVSPARVTRAITTFGVCTSDTDEPGDFYIKGTLFYNGEIKFDECDGNKLIQYGCDDIGNLVVSHAYECNNGCSDGVCIT